MTGKSFSEHDEHFGRQKAHKLTSDIRRQAKSAGWPTRAARDLWVSYKGNGVFVVNNSDPLKEMVLDAEYGTQNTTLKPVIRNFLNNMNSGNLDDYEEAIGNLINGLDIF